MKASAQECCPQTHPVLRRTWPGLLLCLAGCAQVSHVYFEPATETLAESAADIANEQVLLNLAREANDEPAYFLQLGSINGSLTVSGALGFPGANSLVTIDQASSGATSNPRTAISAGGNLTTTVTENPTFTLTPLSGQQFAQTIVEPFSGKLFQALFEQGWEADTLIRTMVSYVEVISCVDGKEQIKIWHNDPSDPTYEQFIELACELKLADVSDSIAVVFDEAPACEIGQNPDPKAPAAPRFLGVALKDAIAAKAAGFDLEPAPSVGGKPAQGYVLGSPAKSYYQYKINGSASLDPMAYSTLTDEFHLNKGYTLFIGDLPERVKPPPGGAIACFHLASFEGALATVANEQRLFLKYFRTKGAPWERAIRLGKSDTVLKAYPLLSFEEEKSYYSPSPLKDFPHIKHDGNTYVVGPCQYDPKDPRDLQTPSNSNREVFTLLVYLFNVSGIDSTKLVIPQVISVP